MADMVKLFQFIHRIRRGDCLLLIRKCYVCSHVSAVINSDDYNKWRSSAYVKMDLTADKGLVEYNREHVNCSVHIRKTDGIQADGELP